MMIDLPAATTTIARIGEYSSPFFDEFITFIWVATGMLIGVFLLLFVKNIIIDAVVNLLENRNIKRINQYTEDYYLKHRHEKTPMDYL